MNFEKEIESISLSGFQVVKNKYFTRQNEPIMTLFQTAISFNTAAHDALNRCEYVEMLLNERNRCILIRPVSSVTNNEAIRWQRGKEKPKYTKIECTSFARPIFEKWDLEPKLHYKTVGRLVQCDKKVMLLFDFTEKEVWEGLKMVKENG